MHCRMETLSYTAELCGESQGMAQFFPTYKMQSWPAAFLPNPKTHIFPCLQRTVRQLSNNSLLSWGFGKSHAQNVKSLSGNANLISSLTDKKEAEAKRDFNNLFLTYLKTSEEPGREMERKRK